MRKESPLAAAERTERSESVSEEAEERLNLAFSPYASVRVLATGHGALFINPH
ncbi:hypothetical protein AB2G49_26780 (plasmid) [Escherichia coli]